MELRRLARESGGEDDEGSSTAGTGSSTGTGEAGAQGEQGN